MATVTRGAQPQAGLIAVDVEVILGRNATINEKDLDELLRELFSDLALAAAPRLAVRFLGDDPRPLRIRVAGKPCPVTWYEAGPSPEPADRALARRVAASLHANADLLITTE